MMADVIPLDPYHGATLDEWTHFDLILGLTTDLLPVVSNPKATISPRSHIKDVGKTPSLYNGDRHVVGIANWTQHVTTGDEIAKWSRERDFGICVQTRHIRALDVDVSDSAESAAIREFILEHFDLPVRSRPNAAKFLVAFELEGEFTKRRFKTQGGVVEFLATGQQFIAIGRHPSGARYEWEGGLPDEFPVVSAADFERLWSALSIAFAVEAPVERSASSKQAKLEAVHENDPVARHLRDKGMVYRVERDGRLHIECPWSAEHTTDSGDSATTYWPAHTGGFEHGGFRCLHAHCEHRTVQDLKEAIGIAEDVADDFEALADESETPTDTLVPPEVPTNKERFRVLSEDEFLDAPPVDWLVKGVLPKAEVGTMYGESGSGKSFMAIDIAAAVAQGVEWRGRRVTQGRVVYVAAEGASGVRNRLKAYRRQHELTTTGIKVIASAPNLLEKADAIDVCKSILGAGGADLVIVDTLAQSMPGGNENSGEDMGKVLSHCKGIHRATGAMVLLIHHSGKDAARGARGWSGLRAACDVELEVMRADDDRVLTVTKQKDGEDGAEFGFRLETVLLDFDLDGDEITSCIVEHRDSGTTRARIRLKGANQKLVMRMFDEHEGLDGGGVEREALIVAMVSDMDPPEAGKKDRRRELAAKAIESVRDLNLLVADGARLKRAGE